MVLSPAKVLPIFSLLSVCSRLWGGGGHRLIRDAALWLRAPAGQRPNWLDR